MAERSYPFDAGAGAIVTEADWGAMASQWVDNGLIDGGAGTVNVSLLAVTAAGLNQVSVSAGSYWVDGFYYNNDDVKALTFTSNADPSNARKDRVVLRLDKTANTIQLAIKEGTPAASPTVPALTVSATVTEIAIATYTVASASSSATAIVREVRPSSRRIRTVTANTDIPWGSIAYNVTDDKLYMRNAAGTVSAIATGSAGGFQVVTSTTRPTGANAFDGLTILESDTKRLMTYIGASSTYFPPVGVGMATYKSADGVSLTGASTVVDADLFVTIRQAGLYRASGTVFYSSNTAAATATFSLTGPASPTWARGTFHHIIGSSTNVVHTTTSAYASGCSIGTPVASTIYAVTFDYLMNLTSINADIAVRTNALSAGTWQLRQGSYLRVERMVL